MAFGSGGVFLSTPSARRATINFPRDTTLKQHFYPRPPRGGRREGKLTAYTRGEFLSTPSARRATIEALGWEEANKISIHALREEGDRECMCRPASALISIHALREEGDGLCGYLTADEMRFLSTPSARRATSGLISFILRFLISIHALREEGDAEIEQIMREQFEFLSTPSARRATCILLFQPVLDAIFLSTPSARRATLRKAGIFL